jgi:hypothetical protein
MVASGQREEGDVEERRVVPGDARLDNLGVPLIGDQSQDPTAWEL